MIYLYLFICLRAAELDDVLLQAMWRRPRGCLRELMSSARTKAAAGGYKKSVAEVIEEELLAVLEPAMHPQKAGGAETARRGRGVSLGAAFGKPFFCSSSTDCSFCIYCEYSVIIKLLFVWLATITAASRHALYD